MYCFRMNGTKKLNIPQYTVLFDTNILLQHFSAVKELTDAYKSNERVKILFRIFSLVEDEYKHNYLVLVKKENLKHENSSRELRQLLSKKISSLKISDQFIFKKASEKLKGIGLEVIRTPYKQLVLKKIANKAAYHMPPFQPEGDKGFKDEIVAASILQSLPEMIKNGKVVFICNDQLLRNYTETFTKNFTDFKVYQSPIDFETELKLYLLELNDELVSEIKKKAEKVFYVPNDPVSLYYSKGVVRRIYESYPSLFSDPQPVNPNWTFGNYLAHQIRKWVPFEEPSFTISPPNFIARVDSTYIWQTSVIYRQEFRGYSQSVLGNYDFSSELGEYVLEFTVEWTTKIDNMGKIFGSDITKITYKNPAGYLDAVGYYYHTPQSNATLAGQGTIPVTNSVAFTIVGKAGIEE